MSVERFGDWDKLKGKMEGSMGVRLAMAIRQATLRNALFLVREIQRGIKSQSPGGKQFAPLSPITIERKGSSKALIDTGFLLSSITHKILNDQAFVGLLRTTMHDNGLHSANLGAIMEYGATIEHPSGATIVIPPRPFLHPVMMKYRDEIVKNYHDAIASVL
jgi:phage gpG-like protein